MSAMCAGKTEYEILAPAGSKEQLLAAVNNGCDAVYLGLDGFNARMKAPNFTAENIAEWVDFCHLYGVKVYVTVNTSVKNEEFDGALATLFAAYKANADGVIVTDLALLAIAGRLGGDLDVVASTQLNCHDEYGARLLQSLGATTVVCARECSLDEVKRIAQTGVKVETFIHGALCVCQSGQCLFSSLVGGNSGNRGLCAQPCRNFYRANTGESGYLLSTSDLDGRREYKDLLDAGATVFKIEGRNRSAEYAGVCSAAFRQLFETGNLARETAADLAEVYSRGEMKYLPYLDGRNDGIIFPSHPRHSGRKVGVVKHGRIVADVAAIKGDGFKVFDKSGNEVCGAVALTSGQNAEAKFSGKVTDGMIVCRTSSIELSARVFAAKRTIDCTAVFVAAVGRKAILTLKNEDVCVVVESEQILEGARTTSTSDEEIVKQLQKTGDSHTTILDIVVKNDNVFIAKSQINDMRRRAVAEFEKAVVANYNARFAERDDVTLKSLQTMAETLLEHEHTVIDVIAEAAQTKADGQAAVGKNIPCMRKTASESGREEQYSVAATCFAAKDVEAAKESGVATVIYKPEFISEETLSAVGGTFVYLDLPSFADLSYLSSFVGDRNIGVVCHNVGHVGFAREHNLPYILGRGMNVFNDYTLALFSDRDSFVFSYELTIAECSRFAAKDGYVFVDGEYPLMQTVHCPFKVAASSTCAKCTASKGLTYTDERGNDFTVVRRKCGRCCFEVFNGLSLSALGKISRCGRYLVDYDACAVRHFVTLSSSGRDDGFRRNGKCTSGRLFNKIN